MPRVSHQLTVPKQAEFCDVTPEAAAIRLYEHQDPPPEKQHLKISVLCLRWSHSCINSKMMFGQGGIDGESIFKLVDLLQREKKLPGDIDQPLDAAQHHGQFVLCPIAASLLF